MIIAFTGPSGPLSREQELAVARRMDELAFDGDLNIWRSGCAHGVDTIAARHAVMTGVLGVELYVPAATHNEELVDELNGIASRIVHCGHYGKEPYRKRNEVMIGGRDDRGSVGKRIAIPKTDLLVAFLKSDKFYRSGEWMTVNIARGASIPVDINVI